MPQRSIHRFIGLDTDTELRFMKPGMYRFGYNIRIGSSENGNAESVENIKGNTLVSFSLPSGTNKTIGSHEDIVNKCAYTFLYNESSLNIQSTQSSVVVTPSGSFNTITVTTTTSHGLLNSELIEIVGSPRPEINGKWIIQTTSATTFRLLNPLVFPDTWYYESTGSSGAIGTVKKFKHSILKYDSLTSTITQVFQHSRLNFNQDFLITGTALISGVLHWTDGYNPPRSIIIADAGSYITDGFFVDTMIDLIRIPPTQPLTCIPKWVNEAGTEVPYLLNKTETNTMEDKSYQFIYRYVYFDDTRSVWSPLTKLIPTGYVDARINRIDLLISNRETALGTYNSRVIKNIELAFRDGDTLNFRFIDRIAFPIGSTTYTFRNDRGYSIIDAAETGKLFDSVPLKSGAMATVQNRLFVGDNTEGFDVTPSDFSITTIFSKLPTVLPKNILGVKSGSFYDVGVVFYDRGDRKSGVYKLGRIQTYGKTFNMEATGDGTFLTTPYFVLFQGATHRFTINGKPPLWADHYHIVMTKNLKKSRFFQLSGKVTKIEKFQYVIQIDYENNPVKYAFQEGDLCDAIKVVTGSAPFSGLKAYYDNGIGLKISQQDGDRIYVERGSLVLNKNEQLIVEAYSVASKSDSDIYYEIDQRYPVINPGTDQRRFGNDNTKTNKNITITSGDISNRDYSDSDFARARSVYRLTFLGELPNDAPGIVTIIEPDIGFRINGIEYTVPAPREGESTNKTELLERIVREINEANANQQATAFVDPDNSSQIVLTNIVKGNNAFNVVVIRPAYTDTRVGVGTLFSATIQLRSQTTPAQAQAYIDSNSFEVMSPNDNTFETWNRNIGRPNIVLSYGDREVRRKTLVRYGGNILQGTKINNVNSFDALDQNELTNFGAVRKLIAASNNQTEGTVLLAVQENEISSLYIGQQMLKSPGGGQNLAVSNEVIGSVNPLQKLVGTINPESVVQHNGSVYGFDLLRGIVWRYGQDGLKFISEEGMKNYFYKKSQELLDTANVKCYGGIDPYHNEYFLTMPSSDSEKKTVVWSEIINLWTSFMAFSGEWYQKINTKTVSFVNGALWEHNSNSLYNNFYGTQYSSKIQLVCNQEPNTVKILQRIEVMSTSLWECPEISSQEGQDSELIGLFDIATPNIYPQDFRSYDKNYVGLVMRDKNTPDMVASDLPLLHGDLMRSEVFTVTQESAINGTPTTSQTNLYFTELHYITSYKK